MSEETITSTGVTLTGDDIAQPRTPTGQFSTKEPVGDEMGELKEKMAQIIQQNEDMKTIITKHETERELTKFNSEKNELLQELEKIHPALSKKHAESTDLKDIKTALSTALEMKKDFPEYETIDKGENTPKNRYITPKKYM